MNKRILSVLIALSILLSTVAIGSFNAFAITTDVLETEAEINSAEATANQYGLLDNPQDGVILHAWNWSYNNIKSNMKTIAECGYTSVQVSPIQVAKENTRGVGVGNWWVFYQPAGFSIDNTGGSALGNKAEFKSMCDEAHKYGVKVIVDVVANHLGNRSDWTTLCDRAYQYESQIANNWLFHNEGSCHDGSAWNVVKGQIGMPDLQTENSHVQQRVLAFLKECIDNGADGFRFDAAKHIETPDDGSNGSQFWPTVINGATSYYASKGTYDALYCYGEILNTCGNGRSYGSYTKYMSVTDNTTGNNIRGAVSGGNASGAASSHYNTGQPANKVVLWAESHDTYANDSQESTNVSMQNINKTWALVGSRNQASALYFARPKGYKQGTLGNIESYDWKNKEVAEVNKFHNFFNGQSDHLSSSGSIAYNERGTEGVVIVNCGGTSTSVNIKANKMKDGTYLDQVSGNTFKVSGGQISGQIGGTGIAVVYNPVTKPVASVTPGSQSYKTDSLKLTLNFANATSGQYSIDGGAFQNFTNGSTITIGAGLPYDTVTTIKVKASDGSTTSDVATYTYTKVDPTKFTTIYFDNSSYNWSNVYAYVYVDASTSNAKWPGVQMQKDSSTGYYYYEVPEEFENGNVLFTESESTSTNRYPADGEAGLEIGATSKILKANHTWEPYSGPVKPTNPTNPTDPVGQVLIGDVTLDGKIDIRDATNLQLHVAKMTTLTGNALIAGETNNDGDLNIRDATNVQMHIAKFPVAGSLVGQYKGGGTVVDPTNPPTPTTPVDLPTDKTVVYFRNTSSWSKVNIHYWNNNNQTTTWPGMEMTLVSGNVYKYEVPNGMTGVIFNDGNGTQTGDLTMPTQHNQIYDFGTSSWSAYTG